MKLHIEDRSQGLEKVWNKLRSVIESNIRQNIMFGEDVDNEQLNLVIQSDGIYHRNEYGLFRESINNN